MFKQVVDAVRQMLLLLRDVEQNKQDIATFLSKADAMGAQKMGTFEDFQMLALPIKNQGTAH